MTLANCWKSVLSLMATFTPFACCLRRVFGGAPKGVEKALCGETVFWRVHFFSAPLRFALKTPENPKGPEKKRTLQKHPFGQPFLRTTPSPLLWRGVRYDFLLAFIRGFLSATGTPNSQNRSYVHYSLPKFTGEWFTNRSNHIRIFIRGQILYTPTPPPLKIPF